MAFFSNIFFRSRSATARYALAVALVGVALVIKLMLATLLTRDMPALLFFLAITGAALFGGFGPGMVAAAIGTVCDEYFFMAPYGSWRLNHADEFLRLALFFGEAASICGICAWLRATHVSARHALRRARRGEAAARALQERVLRVIDHERKRLGHDLHDGLGQQLTGIALLTKTLEERLLFVAPQEAADASALADLTRLAIDWTHDLCRTLSPTDDALDDLPKMLKELAGKTSKLFRVRCRAEFLLASSDISPVHATHLYRIAQEAITNAVRHGRARTIVIRLCDDPHGLLMEVQDDGVGIGSTLASEEGMGLRIMRYRVEMIGGRIDIRRAPPAGTLVTVRRPKLTLTAELFNVAV